MSSDFPQPKFDVREEDVDERTRILDAGGEIHVSTAPEFSERLNKAIAEGNEEDISRSFVRPWNTFGVRLRARIATCGPPRAALVVLENGRPPALRAVTSPR